MQKFILSVLGILFFITSAFAQERINCGPYAHTYVLTAVDQVDVQAVYCISEVDNNSLAIYSFYRQKQSGQFTRGVGYAIRTLIIPNYSAYYTVTHYPIQGNGETASVNPTNYYLSAESGDLDQLWREHGRIPTQIRIGTSFNFFTHIVDEPIFYLRKVNSVAAVIPNLPISTCGPYLKTYRVYGTPDGVRCALEVGGTIRSWFGMGTAGASRYSHLGTGFFGVAVTDWFALDLFCRSGEICNSMNRGALHIADNSGNKVITGAWTEIWNPQNR